jgi:hypothetical protein
MDNRNTSSAHDWLGTQPPRSVSPLSDGHSEANLNQDTSYSGYAKVQGLQTEEMPTMPNHHKHKKMGSVFSIWWPEFLACFIILASFGALIGTVVPFQDRPLPRWPYQLSINTLVSIYTIIFEMALMVIVASCRGRPPRPVIPRLTMWFTRSGTVEVSLVPGTEAAIRPRRL